MRELVIELKPSLDNRFHLMCENRCLKRRKFVEEISLYVRTHTKPYGKDALWSPSYFVSSVGGAPLEVLKRYIQNQEKPS